MGEQEEALHQEEEEEEESDTESDERDATRRRRILITVVSGRRSNGVGGGGACCQADECSASLKLAKRYHRRHKVCERHAKAPVVLVAGLRQRFCQQCSRFHEVSEFDGSKKSCRNMLAGHNERRRKAQPEEGSNVGAEEDVKPSNKHFRSK